MTRLGGIWTAKGALLAATTLVMSPALAAGLYSVMPEKLVSVDTKMGRFTPASGDPRLIAQLKQISLKSRSDYRFTPAMASKDGDSRALTVVVRAPSAPSTVGRQLARTGVVAPSVSQPIDNPVSIAPVAYHLGTKVGIDRFAVTDRTTLDLANLPKANKPVAPAGKPSRIDTKMRVDSVEAAATDRPLDGDRAVEVDLATSYKLTRNLKVTAGVRYKQDTDRLQPMTDNRRDSQAVYVGTQVRF